MERPILSSSKHPCPVCNRTKDGDCRTSQDGNLVLCHSHVEGNRGDTINGYIWIGSIDDPCSWGKWLIPSAEPRKNPDYRPTGKEYRFPYTDDKGAVICEKVRVYQKQDDGTTKKKDWWSPRGIDSNLLMPYRYLEAIDHLKANPDSRLFIDESEMTADLLWSKGLPAIAFGRKFEIPRIRQLLAGFEARLVVCVDQDAVGVRKAEKYLKLFPMAATLKPFPESDFWLPEWLPSDGGLDVRDWVLEGKLTAEQIASAIQEEIAQPRHHHHGNHQRKRQNRQA